MADVSVATPGTSADVVFRLSRSEGAVDIPNNSSYLYVDAYLLVTAYNGAGGPYRLSGDSRGYVNSSLGMMIDVTKGYDLRSSVASSILWGHWEGWVTHDSNGNRTVTFSFGFTGGGGNPLGNGGPGGDSITLTPIPQSALERYQSGYRKQILERYTGSTWRRQILERWSGTGWVRQD